MQFCCSQLRWQKQLCFRYSARLPFCFSYSVPWYKLSLKHPVLLTGVRSYLIDQTLNRTEITAEIVIFIIPRLLALIAIIMEVSIMHIHVTLKSKTLPALTV